MFIIMSISKPIEKSKIAYTWMVLIFGFFIFVSIGFGFQYFWEQSGNEIIAYMLLASLLGSYIIPPLMNITRITIWKYIVGIPLLIFMAPMYINIFIIYSMSNLHDISWGNRETDSRKSMETKKNLEQFRALYLIVWLTINAIYGYGIIYVTREGQRFYILVLTIIVSLTVLMKLMSAITHSLYHC